MNNAQTETNPRQQINMPCAATYPSYFKSNFTLCGLDLPNRWPIIAQHPKASVTILTWRGNAGNKKIASSMTFLKLCTVSKRPKTCPKTVQKRSPPLGMRHRKTHSLEWGGGGTPLSHGHRETLREEVGLLAAVCPPL